MDMGVAYSGISRVCQATGVTLLLCHHFNRKGALYAKPTLGDLSMAVGRGGVAPACFVERREAYEFDGIHRLHVVMGREGGSEYLHLTVNEGLQSDRKWELDIAPGTSDGSDVRQSKRDKKRLDRAALVAEAIAKLVKAGDEPTLNKIKGVCGISGTTAREILQYAIEQDMVEMVEKGDRTFFYPVGIQPESDEQE